MDRFDVNAFLAAHRKAIKVDGRAYLDNRPAIICKDGLAMSIQASRSHYCTPRDNWGPYTAVEIGYPTERIEEFMPYADPPNAPTETVYGWVPVEVVEEVIAAHGGLDHVLTHAEWRKLSSIDSLLKALER